MAVMRAIQGGLGVGLTLLGLATLVLWLVQDLSAIADGDLFSHVDVLGIDFPGWWGFVMVAVGQYVSYLKDRAERQRGSYY